jgi:hypothetical protein
MRALRREMGLRGLCDCDCVVEVEIEVDVQEWKLMLQVAVAARKVPCSKAPALQAFSVVEAMRLKLDCLLSISQTSSPLQLQKPHKQLLDSGIFALL